MRDLHTPPFLGISDGYRPSMCITLDALCNMAKRKRAPSSSSDVAPTCVTEYERRHQLCIEKNNETTGTWDTYGNIISKNY